MLSAQHYARNTRGLGKAGGVLLLGESFITEQLDGNFLVCFNQSVADIASWPCNRSLFGTLSNLQNPILGK